ncbi:AMP binding domains-containing protein [Desulfonema magnum]|uniref:AMP binding domains-containing protein n=2 Tax=Desulfonema magnum TaxID=45655 RepID=A0A975BHM1_9BACT|nr:AMP binding domains-containing protein [Desulfonema magnum]
MFDSFINMIQWAGALIRQLNEFFYFCINIETYVSWAVLALLWLLYTLTNKYFLADPNKKQLTSFELIKLLGLYLLILSAITLSYTDFRKIMEQPEPKHSFFMILTMAIILVVVLAWAGEKSQDLRKWILYILYIPLGFLILSNGKILEDRLDYLKTFLPRTNIAAVNFPGEMDALYMGGVVETKLIERIETIINSHEAVKESALVGYQDDDKFIKTYAFVVLNDLSSPSEGLKEEILNHTSRVIRRNRIAENMYPYWIKFTDKRKLPRPARDGNYKKIQDILNKHKKVEESAVILDDGKTSAYVVLKKEFSDSRALASELLDHVLEGIKNHNRISPFLEPKWIEFIDRDDVPRTPRGINRSRLQKQIKNWSFVFPHVPVRTADEKE